MADPLLIERLRQGVSIWNEWKASQDTTPTSTQFDLSGIDFAEVNVHLSGIDLRFCNLRGCNMSSFQAVGALFHYADLHEANLSRTNLKAAKFDFANLPGAVLAGANLEKASFAVADLIGANLSGANLDEANLSNANLDQATLAGANLSRTCFLQVSLKETDFSSCLLASTIFGQVDLSGITGSDRIGHDASIYLDILSIYMSGGKIHERLLHAASLPASFIALIPTLNYEEE
jgi:uncharacterized protein YjbI with pentapeptide repeats